MKTELQKYAELLISMSSDFLLGKISESHYIDMLTLINTNIKKL